ncbi:zinc ribbon domain-containing protein [Verminephrobacter aporrectodeae]|uniref:zinc ribbon domain-containing protein n=1 Tax=Verminephrobacter aporrectodeae TaxID=1110389 RepID=UPI002244EE87|nr:zinc ribbon domain-containing protein [Verminephrobacter aporrectodeae]
MTAQHFFASSKTCSACGHKLSDLPLSVRAWTCPNCGAIHGRDLVFRTAARRHMRTRTAHQILTSKSDRMNTLNEAELTDFTKNNAVKRLCIVQSESGKYQIIVNLTWKEGEFNLITTRKTIRKWSSLDRLARHIRENYGIPPSISLSLHQLENQSK